MDSTLLSQKEFNNIFNTCMTADEAYMYLSKNIAPYSFCEALNKFAGGGDIKEILTDALCEYNPGANRGSVSRRVRGWLGGSHAPSDRETYLQICFALKLSEKKAQDFLCCTSDCGFHYRNPRELTYSFALRNGMSYSEAVSLYNSLPPLPKTSGGETVYTEPLYNEFYNISNVEQFKSFYIRNIDKLGTLHNTAYLYFKSFIDCLRDPDADKEELFGSNINKSETFSIERITEEYLRMNIPSDTSGGTYIQKIIKKYWPSATSVKNMYSRSEDVTRKVLMILYAVTEGIAPNVNYDFVIDDDLTPKERFEEHYDRLCIMLTDSSMSLPDPRNAFDWVVLYSLRTDNSEEIREEMQNLLNRIFDLTETKLTEQDADVLE